MQKKVTSLRHPAAARMVCLALCCAVTGLFLSCVTPEPEDPLADQSPTDSGHSVEIEYIAHASFILTAADGSSVLVDPYQSGWWLGYDFPRDLESVDAVLLSHPHPDHDAGFANGDVVPWNAGSRVIDEPGDFALGDLAVRGIKGRHAEPYGEEFKRKNTVWIIDAADIRIVHLGDNEPVTEELAVQLGDVDILMIPVDDVEHILSFDAVEEYRQRLSPRVVIPMHYRHADLEVDPDSPNDLGPIDGWFSRQDNARRLGTHKISISKEALGAHPEVWLFEHSTRVAASEE